MSRPWFKKGRGTAVLNFAILSGYKPITLEGWLILIMYIMTIAFAAMLIKSGQKGDVAFAALLFGCSTLLYFFIAHAKTDRSNTGV